MILLTKEWRTMISACVRACMWAKGPEILNHCSHVYPRLISAALHCRQWQRYVFVASSNFRLKVNASIPLCQIDYAYTIVCLHSEWNLLCAHVSFDLFRVFRIKQVNHIHRMRCRCVLMLKNWLFLWLKWRQSSWAFVSLTNFREPAAQFLNKVVANHHQIQFNGFWVSSMIFADFVPRNQYDVRSRVFESASKLANLQKANVFVSFFKASFEHKKEWLAADTHYNIIYYTLRTLIDRMNVRAYTF